MPIFDHNVGCTEVLSVFVLAKKKHSTYSKICMIFINIGCVVCPDCTKSTECTENQSESIGRTAWQYAGDGQRFLDFIDRF